MEIGSLLGKPKNEHIAKIRSPLLAVMPVPTDLATLGHPEFFKVPIGVITSLQSGELDSCEQPRGLPEQAPTVSD